jgi:ribose-phosphate pyrophosphokinase
VVSLSGGGHLAPALARACGFGLARLEARSFPDGETYLRYHGDLDGRTVILVGSLDRPNDKLVPLLFAAGAARDLGASSIGLVAPYLAYLRQDRRFRPGEAVTSRHFAALLSAHLDWLVTVDAHLHRLKALGDFYAVPTVNAASAPLIAAWIGAQVRRPLIVGPDAESKQWVREVAERAGAPFVVARKLRRGDREVEVEVPEVERWRECTPVVVDDIISTARTMIATLAHLRGAGLASPVCIGVHAVFAGDAYADLVRAGAARIVTTNTVEHESNAIDVAGLLAAAIGDLVGAGKEGSRSSTPRPAARGVKA